jgi:hypothetical protein
LIGYVVALAAVTLVSLFIGFVLGQVNLANVSMLYLLAVLAQRIPHLRLVFRTARSPLFGCRS